jgi:hypothetical protein
LAVEVVDVRTMLALQSSCTIVLQCNYYSWIHVTQSLPLLQLWLGVAIKHFKFISLNHLQVEPLAITLPNGDET